LVRPAHREARDVSGGDIGRLAAVHQHQRLEQRVGHLAVRV
jgi:hypothetical protein